LNCLGAIGIGVFGMLFANATVPTLLIPLSVLVTLCNNLLSYSLHSYQSELFPTRIRSRAIGFVYSWSRLSAALSGLDRRLRSAHSRPRAGSDRPLAQFATPR
jgi:putative MFS transporter